MQRRNRNRRRDRGTQALAWRRKREGEGRWEYRRWVYLYLNLYVSVRCFSLARSLRLEAKSKCEEGTGIEKLEKGEEGEKMLLPIVCEIANFQPNIAVWFDHRLNRSGSLNPVGLFILNRACVSLWKLYRLHALSHSYHECVIFMSLRL